MLAQQRSLEIAIPPSGCLLRSDFSFIFPGDGSLRPNHPQKESKPTYPRSPACAAGCKPETTAPALDAQTPEDAAAQKELAELARDLHRGTPGAYDKLAKFADKNLSSVWGQRAALALGYDDYSHSKAQQALTWLQKAKSDTLL